MLDVLIIGAGPAGCTAARLLAEGGCRVGVVEEHACAGLPVHCTGIVGEDVFRDFAIPRSLIWTTLDRFRVYAPGGRYLDLGGTTAYALDRQGLDAHLAAAAATAGAQFLYGNRVIAITQDAASVRVLTQGGVTMSARLCVLACGAMSNLPARAGIRGPRAYYKTVQSLFPMADLGGAEIYLGSDLASGSFGYAAQLPGGLAKVGIITRGPAAGGYKRLLQRLERRLQRPTTAAQYRRIPMGACRSSVVGRVLAVGDAAGQTKTTTGGGIYYAMLCARILAATLLRARGREDFALSELACYDRTWRGRIGAEIQAGLWLRGLFEQVADDGVDKLLAAATSPSIQEIVAREWDFDFHRGLLVALARTPQFRSHVWQIARHTLPGRRLWRGILQAVTVFDMVAGK